VKKIILLSLAFIVLLSLIYAPHSEAKGDVLRLHVIANSDSNEDQAVKLLVRDAILEYERDHMTACETAAEAKHALMKDGAGLLAAVENTLCENGFNYSAQLKLGNYEFPNRDYVGEIYPAGMYDALRVILGAGEGENWWCVMFPPLCILELPNGDVDYDRLKTNSFIVNWLKGVDGGKLWQKMEAKLRLRQN